MSVAFPGELPYLFSQQGTHADPFAYVVPASLEVVPTAATATFDGSGAGSPFLACLSFYAQSGELLSRVYPTLAIAAGEVSPVSYAPFPGGLTSSSTPFVLDVTDGSTSVSPTTEIDFTSGATVTNLGSGVAGVAVAGAVGTTIARYQLANASIGSGAQAPLDWTHLSGAALLDLTTPAAPQPVATGVYAITISMSPGVAITPGVGMLGALVIDALGAVPFIQTSHDVSGAGTPADGTSHVCIAGTWPCPSTGIIRADASNFDSNPQPYVGFASVLQLS